MEQSTILGKDKTLLATLSNAAIGRENVLDIIAMLQPGNAFQGVLLTVNEYVKFLQDQTGRKVSDATVRNLIHKDKIDGIYKKESTNLRYLILLTEKTKKYRPRKYTKQ